MSSSTLRFICRKAICGGGRRTMSSSSSSSIEASRISPWLMLPPADGRQRFYSLSMDKVMSIIKREAPSAEGLVKLVGSSHGWIASFNLDKQHILLSNPISGCHMKLPDIHTLPASSFHPQCRTVVDKIILSSSPDAEDCRAVMTFGTRGMALCCPGRSTHWISAGHDFYEDFVYSSRQKRLFCITLDAVAAECWDLTDLSSPRKDSISNLDQENNSTEEEEEEDPAAGEVWRYPRYLVVDEHSDRLFVVTRHVLERIGRDGSYAKTIYFGVDRGSDDSYPYKTFDFDVHEIIDWEGGKIRYMDASLDGLAMFVGNNHSFALSAAEFPELQPDSIYFTDDPQFTPLDNHNPSYGGHDIGIFNYVHSSISSIYYSSHASDITRISPAPMWFPPTPR